METYAQNMYCQVIPEKRSRTVSKTHEEYTSPLGDQRRSAATLASHVWEVMRVRNRRSYTGWKYLNVKVMSTE